MSLKKHLVAVVTALALVGASASAAQAAVVNDPAGDVQRDDSWSKASGEARRAADLRKLTVVSTSKQMVVRVGVATLLGRRANTIQGLTVSAYAQSTTKFHLSVANDNPTTAYLTNVQRGVNVCMDAAGRSKITVKRDFTTHSVQLFVPKPCLPKPKKFYFMGFTNSRFKDGRPIGHDASKVTSLVDFS